jgi:hypothetical protein
MRFFLLILIPFFAIAQKDSSIHIVIVSAHLSGQLPEADLVKRFGPSLCVGGSVMYKFRSNWIAGLTAGYAFGSNVKEDVLTQLRNPDKFIANNNGNPADLRVSERVFLIHFTGGRLIPISKKLPNSGIFLSLGAGYMQHKVNLYDAEQKIASINGDLIKGYDRLSGGFSLSQFVGYLYVSNNLISNFYAGFELFEGFTKSLRKINYDTGLPDTRKRFDLLSGFRIGWILPLYKRRPQEYYFY